jgi:hypothetical protein
MDKAVLTTTTEIQDRLIAEQKAIDIIPYLEGLTYTQVQMVANELKKIVRKSVLIKF